MIAAIQFDPVASALLVALASRDVETSAHCERVAKYSVRLGLEMKLLPFELDNLRTGALLHDVGKLSTRDDVLRKPGHLEEDEREHMREHAREGAKIVQQCGFPSSVVSIVAEHQERWDGCGYPARLREEEICLGARIFAVADTLDAITSKRCYRAARPYPMARAEILKHSGSQFDPAVVKAFLSIPPPHWRTQ